MTAKVLKFQCTSPCNNCPYRKDAPLQLWDKHEFVKLLAGDKKPFTGVYNCHKNNGSICIGYLMNQEKRGFPNLNLRMVFMRNGVDRKYLDKLKCKSEMFNTIEEMASVNYPELNPQNHI